MKAISPVIATVIIVAVAIAISIAVALWLTGIATAFTGVEKLSIVNAYANATRIVGEQKVYEITVIVRNTGTKPATIDMIFVNEVPYDVEGLPMTLNPGETTTIKFNYTGTPGQVIGITLHTASGGRYPHSVPLP